MSYFVRNIDKTVGFYVTTSIKGHNQREAIYLPKRFQWVNISVQSVNDSLQDQQFEMTSDKWYLQ